MQHVVDVVAMVIIRVLHGDLGTNGGNAEAVVGGLGHSFVHQLLSLSSIFIIHRCPPKFYTF